MRLKELAFKFDEHDTTIFATYVFATSNIYFKRLSDGENVEKVEDVLENYIDLDVLNTEVLKELVKAIQNDNELKDKIVRNSSTKLLLQYPMPNHLKE